MSRTLNLKHLCVLSAGAVYSLAGSASLAAETPSEPATLIQCHELLPSGVRYDFKIVSNIDTREGKRGELSVTLVDPSRPDSQELPDGTGEFIRCVQKVVGIGDAAGWPES